MFTQTTEYALRAMAYLARDPHSPRTTQQIAEVAMVPSGYLAKVLKQLSVAGLVHSQRGPSGGYRLALDPREITVLDVVSAVGSVPRILQCPLALPEHAERLCALHQLLDGAAEKIERAFEASTLGDLVDGTDEYAGFHKPGQPFTQLGLPGAVPRRIASPGAGSPRSDGDGKAPTGRADGEARSA